MLTSTPFRVSGKLLAVALCVAAAVPVARADDASRRAKAEEMMKLTKTDSMMEEQLNALNTRVHDLATQQTTAANMTPAQKLLTDAYLKQVQGTTDEEVSWAKLRPVIVQAYADSYTEADLDAIVAFYKTPAGQSVVAKTPEVAQKTMTVVQDRIKDLQPKLAKLTEDYVTKMKATEAPAPSLAAPAAKPAASAPKPAAKAAPAK